MQAVMLCSPSCFAGRAVNYNSQTVAAIVKMNSYYGVPLYLSAISLSLCV